MIDRNSHSLLQTVTGGGALSNGELGVELTNITAAFILSSEIVNLGASYVHVSMLCRPCFLAVCKGNFFGYPLHQN